MTRESLAFLLISGGMSALFLSGRVSVDLVALTGLVMLLACGLLSSNELLLGFSSPVTITLACTFVIAGALRNTGVVDSLALRIKRIARERELPTIFLLVLVTAFFSAFMNNVVATALLMPTAATLTRSGKVSSARLFMPLSFASLLGGSLTLLGTPPNIVASELLAQRGYVPYHLFDFAPYGVVLVIAGGAALTYLSRWLRVESRSRAEGTTAGSNDVSALYGLRDNLAHIRVTPDSLLCNETLSSVHAAGDLNLFVIAIEREGKRVLAPEPDEMMLPGDMLVVRYCEGETSLPAPVERLLGTVEIESTEIGLLEVIVAPRSALTGKSLRELRFRDRHHVHVLALLRDGKVYHTEFSDLPLQVGDALLVHGARKLFPLLDDFGELIILGEPQSYTPRRPGRAFAIFALCILVVVPLSTSLPSHVAALIGMLIVTLSGAIAPSDAYREVEWKVLVLLAALIPLGPLIVRTGLADQIAGFSVDLVGGQGEYAVVLTLMVIVNLLSQALDASLAVLLIGPIAILIAERSGYVPQQLLMAVTLASSLAFLTPFSHRANLLVVSAGAYRTRDFIKIGAPLTVVTFVLVLLGYWLFN